MIDPDWKQTPPRFMSCSLPQPFRSDKSYIVHIDENLFLSPDEANYEKAFLAEKIYGGEEISHIYQEGGYIGDKVEKVIVI